MDNISRNYRELLKENRRVTDGFQYTIPSPTSYPYQWLWDSCFHAIILSHFKVADAKKEILSLLSKQFQNGMIPHMIYWKKYKKTDFPRIKWGKEETSTITQPPMLAFAVWQIFQKEKDKLFLRSVYPHLYHFYRYLLTERDPHENHLIGIINPDESGEDNSPRFDLPLGLPPVQTLKENIKRRLKLVAQNIECKFDAPFCMRNFFWVKDVSFNSIMVANLTFLAKVARELGNSEDATYFMKVAEDISSAMRQFMRENGVFYSTYGEEYKKIKVKTWAIFAPLFAKILGQEEAKQLVNRHLLNTREFWTNFPIPTTSLDEPSFDPQGYWRGSSWIATNWFVYKGLLNYGFRDIAEEIKKSSTSLIQKSGFREYFNPQTGEGLGAESFTWGGLVIDMDGFDTINS
ncbi:MAG: trehalase family glycosidase [Candidatus Daviesbacteria bacterium]|nr:trehalase family glycosidase [Candidatus Daviesbacteria bacterium]